LIFDIRYADWIQPSVGIISVETQLIRYVVLRHLEKPQHNDRTEG